MTKVKIVNNLEKEGPVFFGDLEVGQVFRAIGHGHKFYIKTRKDGGPNAFNLVDHTTVNVHKDTQIRPVKATLTIS